MPSQFPKLWIQRALNRNAINRVTDAIQVIGKALPCQVKAVNGAIVTVAFQVNSAPWPLPQITIPKAESNWIRMPTQVGDFGYTAPADVYLGGISGIGGGVADLAQPANLSSLVFVPVSNANSGPIDQNAAQIQGPNGAIVRTTQGTTSEIVTDQSGTTITFGTTSLTLTASGVVITVGGSTFTFDASNLTVPDVIVPNGSVNNHVHGGVQSGGSDTGGMIG